MPRTTSFLLLTSLSLLLVGCSTVPEKSELTRLDRADLRATVAGNTYTRLTDYGRWAEYVESLDSGYGRASGSWGSDSARAEYSISADGEWCTVYSGEPDWAAPDHEYCSVLYTDSEGNYYSETITNTFEPANEGRIRQIELRSGDDFGLAPE